ncbi:hypothetical protein H8356DRAFT_1329360 [Neocallimastix lanati (nom. inval.)]|nr:hypothetical protein H8356DRAFT_1329360 [Neocallimastix sp. JGI-2020a]
MRLKRKEEDRPSGLQSFSYKRIRSSLTKSGAQSIIVELYSSYTNNFSHLDIDENDYFQRSKCDYGIINDNNSNRQDGFIFFDRNGKVFNEEKGFLDEQIIYETYLDIYKNGRSVQNNNHDTTSLKEKFIPTRPHYYYFIKSVKLAVGQPTFNYSHYLNLTYLLALTSVPFRFKEFEPIFENNYFKEFEPIFENNYFLIHTTTHWIGFNVFVEKWHRLPMSNLILQSSHLNICYYHHRRVVLAITNHHYLFQDLELGLIKY